METEMNKLKNAIAAAEPKFSYNHDSAEGKLWRHLRRLAMTENLSKEYATKVLAELLRYAVGRTIDAALIGKEGQLKARESAQGRIEAYAKVLSSIKFTPEPERPIKYIDCSADSGAGFYRVGVELRDDNALFGWCGYAKSAAEAIKTTARLYPQRSILLCGAISEEDYPESAVCRINHGEPETIIISDTALPLVKAKYDIVGEPMSILTKDNGGGQGRYRFTMRWGFLEGREKSLSIAIVGNCMRDAVMSALERFPNAQIASCSKDRQPDESVQYTAEAVQCAEKFDISAAAPSGRLSANNDEIVRSRTMAFDWTKTGEPTLTPFVAKPAPIRTKPSGKSANYGIPISIRESLLIREKCVLYKYHITLRPLKSTKKLLNLSETATDIEVDFPSYGTVQTVIALMLNFYPGFLVQSVK